MMTDYIRLTKGLEDRGKLIPSDTLYDNVTDHDIDWYSSLYYYNDEHYNKFQETHSISGITGLTTDKLIFDFDSKDNLESARKDAQALVERLQIKYLFNPDNIQIYYSGSKGFHIVIDIDKRITSKQMKILCLKFAEGLETLDSVIYNDNRIIRVAGTKHPTTGLYKIPIAFTTLIGSLDKIKEAAKTADGLGVNFNWGIQTLYEGFLTIEKKKEIKTVEAEYGIDWANKPAEWRNCKWALLQGYFKEGKRNEALMIIVSSCKALGYDKQTAYYLAKSALKKREVLYNIEFDKEELWATVVEPVYAEQWKGGQYTCKQPGWLHNYCESLGVHKCSVDRAGAMGANDISTMFQEYANSYDDNVLTTGISSLDENPNCRFLVGTFNGIVAAPGAGKSSISLGILEHLSQKGIDTLFFSYDMFHSMVYLRIVQRLTGLHQDEVFDIFNTDPVKTQEIKDMVQDHFRNVNFCFTQGQDVDAIEDTFEATENKTGRKIKMVIVDYNELVMSKFSDPVQAGSEVAQRLRQLANDKQTCVITLLQPSKMFANPAEEVDSYRAAKGSSSIAQSMTMMLGISRPGFNPQEPENDKFLTVTAVKNRNGPLFSVDMHWDGIRGTVRKLSYQEVIDLEAVRREREERREEREDSWR